MMLIQNERHAPYAITLGALLLCALVTLSWFYPSTANAVGKQQRIEGPLTNFPGSANQPNPDFSGLSTGGCVVRGVNLTGTAPLVAINYQPSSLGCWFFSRVDNSVNAPGWCSQWVVPNAQDHCLPQPPKKPTWIEVAALSECGITNQTHHGIEFFGTKTDPSDYFEFQEFKNGSWQGLGNHQWSTSTWHQGQPGVGTHKYRTRLVGLGGPSAWFQPSDRPCVCYTDGDDGEW